MAESEADASLSNLVCVLAGAATPVDLITPTKLAGPNARMARISHPKLRTQTRKCSHVAVSATESTTLRIGPQDLVLKSLVVAVSEERANKTNDNCSDCSKLSHHNQVMWTEWPFHQRIFYQICQRWHTP